MKSIQSTTNLPPLRIVGATIYKTIHDDILTDIFIPKVTELLSKGLNDKFLFICSATSINELKSLESSLDDVRAIYSGQPKNIKNEILSEWEKGNLSTIITIRNIQDITLAVMKDVKIIMSMNVLPEFFLKTARATYPDSMFYFVDFNSIKYILKTSPSGREESKCTEDMNTHTIDTNSYTVLLGRSVYIEDHVISRRKICIYSINCNKPSTQNKCEIYVEGVNYPAYYERVIQLRINFYEEFLNHKYFFLIKTLQTNEFEFHVFFNTTEIKCYALDCLNLLKRKENLVTLKQKNFRRLLKHISRMKIVSQNSELYSEMYHFLENKNLVVYEIYKNEILSKLIELRNDILM
jgi:hypothetical protein